MKLKRLMAGLIAVAMTASMIPTLVFADEAESGTKEPAAVEETEAKEEEKKPAAKETKPAEEKKEPEKKAEPEEKPAESEDKKAEEPAEKEDKKEEPAETEAPAESKEAEPAETEDKAEPEAPAEKTPEETEKPAAVTGKIPRTSDSSNPKKAPITVKTITNVVMDYSGKATLKWDKVDGARDYSVVINTIEEYPDDNKLENVSTIINTAIKEGRLRKSDTKFKFTIYAYDDNSYIIGKAVKEFTLGESLINVSEPSVLSIPGAKIKNGRLYWKKVTKVYVYEYCIRINGVFADWYSNPPKNGANLKPLINSLIKEGRIEKAKNNKYSVLLWAYGGDDIAARYSSTVTYKTSAKRTQHYTFENVVQNKGKLSWDDIKEAKKYVIGITDPHGGDDDIVRTVKTTSADINNIVADEMNFEGAPDYLDYRLEAYNSSGDRIAIYDGSFHFVVQPNTLSVSGKTGKVKYSKLKKKKQTLNASQVINGVGTGRGKMTYIKQSGNGNISINKSTGKVSIKKKGLKKGKTYSVVVTISAAGNGGYDPSEEQTVTFKIKVTK